MNLNLIKQPNRFSFSKNPIVYKFGFGNSTSNSIYPSIKLTFSGFMSSGENWGFSFINPETGKEEVVKMKVSATPIQNGFDLPDGTPYSVSAEYTEAFVKHLNANTTISKFYSISSNGSVVNVVAKEPIAQLVPYNYVFTGSPGDPSHTIFSAYWQAEKNSLKLAVNVYVEKGFGSNEYTRASSLIHPVGDSDVSELNIQDILHNEIIQHEYDALPQDSLSFKLKTSRKFYLEYGYEVEGKPTNYYKTLPSVCMIGGVSSLDYDQNDALSFLSSHRSLLSWQENKKTVLRSDTEFLSWMNYTHVSLIANLSVVVNFNDSTSTTTTLSGYNISLAPFEAATFDTSFDRLGIDSLETTTKKIVSYEVSVVSASPSVSSESRLYILDREYHQNSRPLFYLNSFGATEVIQTRGSWEKSIDVERTVSSRILDSNSVKIKGQTFQYDQVSSERFVIKTSFFSKKSAEAFQEVVLASKIFHKQNGVLLPLLAIDSGSEITQDDQFIHSFEFPAISSFAVPSYSAKKDAPVLVPILDCGLKGYKLDERGFSTSSHGTLTVYNERGVSVTTATFNSTTKEYLLASKITQQGNYMVAANITVGFSSGSTPVAFYETHQQINESIYIRFNGVPTSSSFRVTGHYTEDIFINKYDGNGEISASVNSALGATIFHATDRISINTPCAKVFKDILCTSSKVMDADFSNATQVEEFRLFTNELSGVLDYSNHNSVKIINLQNNSDVTGITIGTPVNLTSLVLKSTGLTDANAETLLRDLWSKRKLFTASSISVDLSSNSITVTAEVSDLINGTDVAGTGKYISDGLVQNNFTITL